MTPPTKPCAAARAGLKKPLPRCAFCGRRGWT
nr:MAG TPA: ATP-dependent Clp protease ATP-binding subunit [Caudoviricetes sp.]